ncbi:hypothetical protein [Rhizobium alvei]|uniref:YdgA family protein n=1 Tax=Rhizobium alvei TaxID=1132659 RepID=A0ABT8YKR8_9HYPH|nr:hypothetical protein [Rhizobium alvei]MDO6964217.1 hypothetical protein [Rhizobium alvei]
MRKALYSTVAVLIATSPIAAGAAEVTPEGAQAIEKSLTYYLPQSVIDTGFLKVTPGSKRYEMSVDLQKLVDMFKSPDFTISGLKPFVHYLTPQDDGLWKVELNDHLNVSGSFMAEGTKNDFTYTIDKMVFDGLYDPTIYNFPKATQTFEKLQFKTQGTNPKSILATIDRMVSDSSAVKRADGLVDFDGTFTGSKLSEVIEDPTTGQVTMAAGAMNGTVSVDGVNTVALRDLIIFVADLARANPQQLTVDQDRQLKELIKANMPFVENLAETIGFSDVKINAQGMDASLGELTYNIAFNGIRNDSEVSFGMSARDLVMPAGILPPGTEPAVPESASFGVAVKGLDLKGMFDYLVANADFSKNEPLTKEQSDELGKIVLGDGMIKVDFRDVTVKSANYDMALSGTMRVDPNKSDKPEADITITARDFDKTVAYLQQTGQTVPEFGQAAFMALAFKGFGAAQPDGTVIWNMKIDAAGDVTVNGQPMKF